MAEFIPITKPSITQLEIDYVNDAITNGWGSKCYDYIYKFQDTFATYLDSKYALATSSCTGAIHLAYLSIGLQPDDEVICPDITWIASVAPITYIGAKPVFVDILPDTWCIDPARIEAAITSKTKAIMPVHLYGNVCEMDEIMAIARKHNLFVIEDAAEALGSEYKGRKAGSIGDLGVFSFHGTKTMTTGEGGMLVTNNADLFREACIYNDHGRDPKINKTFWMERVGYKYKMSNLQAALGLAQVERLSDLVEKKRTIFSFYQQKLSAAYQLNVEQSYAFNSYWMPTLIVPKSTDFSRDEFFIHMKKCNIDGRPFFYPLSSLSMFESRPENIVSYEIFERGVNLPSFLDMEEETADYVVNSLIAYFAERPITQA